MRSGLKRSICSTLGVTVLLAAPAVAQAAEKTVSMGTPLASQRTFQRTGSDVNDFFPHTTTIHVGDTVRFVPAGLHTVDLPGRRTRKLPLVTPLGQKVAGAIDAANAPFFFNGADVVGFNPTLLRSNFGRRLSYTGARALNSGLPLTERPRPMTVRFRRVGTVRYFCDVHLGMTGIVRVVRGARRVPSARQDRARVRAQLAADLRTARALPRNARPPANTIDVGLEGRGNVSFFDFVPKQLTVPVGTTVRFRMAARSEVHTATTGPGDPENEPASYLGVIQKSFESPAFDPRGVYPSDPPPAIAALTPTFHGNGFWNSGALDQDPTTPLPTQNAVALAAPGVYQFFCLIHPFMRATVTVQ
jgi:plastocyanin